MAKNNNDQIETMLIPGMEELFEAVLPKETSADEFFEGKPRGEDKRYFDASILPDAPSYQDSADGANIFMMYVLFPTKEEFDRGVQSLTFGQRKLSDKAIKLVTIDSVHPGKNNKSFLQMWEESLYNKNAVNKEEMIALIREIYDFMGSDIEEYNKSLGSKLESIVVRLRKEEAVNEGK